MTEGFDGDEDARRADQEGSAPMAWVWSKSSKGEISQITSEDEGASHNVPPARMTGLGGTKMALSDRTKRGIILAGAVLAGLVSIWLALLVLALAAFLIAWGQDPKRTGEFVGGLPYGNQLLKGLAQLNLILATRSSEQ